MAEKKYLDLLGLQTYTKNILVDELSAASGHGPVIYDTTNDKFVTVVFTEGTGANAGKVVKSTEDVVTAATLKTDLDVPTIDASGEGGANGTFKVTVGSTDSYVAIKGLTDAAFNGTDSTVTQGSTNLITSGAVWTAIDNLAEPMVFKGTLGAAGDNPTITELPTASSANEGFTYKVITAGTYASIAAKVGDVFVSNGTAWVIIPAGDDVEDTWRGISVNGTEVQGSAISTGNANFVNGTNTTAAYDSTNKTITFNVATAGVTSSTPTLGVVKVDNSTITVDASGTISATTQASTAAAGTWGSGETHPTTEATLGLVSIYSDVSGLSLTDGILDVNTISYSGTGNDIDALFA